MICKKIANPKRRSSKAQRVIGLVKYIRTPEGENSKEKCIYFGARGFYSAHPNVQMHEMVALAMESTRSRDPVNHYVLSWREGERPTPEQIEEAINIFMDELSMNGFQVLYGVHDDTRNVHCHIALCRINPETLKAVEINKGFDLEAVHRAICRIEHKQGWKRERNARYMVMESGELARVASEHKQTTEPDQQRRDMENRTGAKSAVRIAKETAGDIFKTANTWQELHTRLAAVNLRYQKTGSGAVIFSGEIGIKASSVDRAASLAKLEKRLGIFEEFRQDQDAVGEKQPSVEEFKNEIPRPLVPGFPGWQDYTSQRKAYKHERDTARLALRKQHNIERAEMHARHRTARTEFFASRSWIGSGLALNAMRSVMAYEQKSENIAMRERQAAERKRLVKQHPPLPSFKEWLPQHQGPAIANAWRYRANLPQEILGHSLRDIPAPPAEDIRAFKPRIKGKQVEYVRRNASDDLLFGHQPSFVDLGSAIRVHNWQDEDTTLAALQLAAQKWGSFSLRGNHDYIAMCVRLAAEHGLKIKNPELQDDIKRERERFAQERANAQKSVRQLEMEKYTAEVKADRYQLTCVRKYADGSAQLIIYGKEDGYSAQELTRRARYIDGLPSDVKITPLYDQPRIASDHQDATSKTPSTTTSIGSQTSSQVSQQPPVLEKNDKHGKKPKAALGAIKL